MWFGLYTSGFIFRNNIISNCNCFWLQPENTLPTYTFTNSLITDNTHFMGLYTSTGLMEAKENNHEESGINRKGKILLSKVKTEGLPKDYLNLSLQSDAKNQVQVFLKCTKVNGMQSTIRLDT